MVIVIVLLNGIYNLEKSGLYGFYVCLKIGEIYRTWDWCIYFDKS